MMLSAKSSIIALQAEKTHIVSKNSPESYVYMTANNCELQHNCMLHRVFNVVNSVFISYFFHFDTFKLVAKKLLVTLQMSMSCLRDISPQNISDGLISDHFRPLSLHYA